jgi:hypothetical protein
MPMHIRYARVDSPQRIDTGTCTVPSFSEGSWAGHLVESLPFLHYLFYRSKKEKLFDNAYGYSCTADCLLL